MAKAKKSNVNNTINIKSLPVQCHIGASKFVNDDWGTIAFSIPRNQIQNKFADMELRYNFIYFLFGYENSKEAVYVGQAKKRNDGESVLARLREHDKSTTEKYRDKWEWIIAVTNKDDAWGLDDLNALEHAFYNEIPAEQNLNGNNPNSGGADYAAYVDKINQIKSLITAIGFNIFSDEETTEKIQVTSEVNEFTIVEDLQNGMARIPEIVTPQKVVKAMVDMLPKEVWNSQTTFLDPACKGGEYLREIYDRLMDCELLQSEFPNAIERSNHILKNQIYGIALSQVSLERTTKKLLGEDRNIRVISDYIRKLKGFNLGSRPDGSQNNISDILNKEFGREMKFDVVIGNPPYQENTGGGTGIGTGSALYDKFIQNAEKIAPLTCMIVPMRWMMCGAQGVNKEWAYKEIHSKKYKALAYYKDSKEVFNGVDIRGGVAYFLKDNNYCGECHIMQFSKGQCISDKVRVIADDNTDNFIEDDIAVSIVGKVKSRNTFDSIVGAVHAYGIETNTLTIGSGIKLYRNYGQIEECSIDEIPRQLDSIYTYKVIAVYAFGKGVLGERVPTPKVIGPMEICSATYLIVGPNKDKSVCDNIAKYMQTKLFSLLVGLIKATQIAPRQVYKYVPLQDFSSASDIDWSQPISDIDRQLYVKYNLTQEEVNYIESVVKPMN